MDGAAKEAAGDTSTPLGQPGASLFVVATPHSPHFSASPLPRVQRKAEHTTQQTYLPGQSMYATSCAANAGKGGWMGRRMVKRTCPHPASRASMFRKDNRAGCPASIVAHSKQALSLAAGGPRCDGLQQAIEVCVVLDRQSAHSGSDRPRRNLFPCRGDARTSPGRAEEGICHRRRQGWPEWRRRQSQFSSPPAFPRLRSTTPV
jgi:hypothetical protein